MQKKEIIVLNHSKTVMTKLRAISKLETEEMNFIKTMSWEKALDDLLPDYDFDDIISKALFKDEIVFTFEWKVVAWIDLEKIATWDIITNLDGTVSIKLPEAEILYVTIERNEIPTRSLWIITRIVWWYENMETEIRNAAKQEMEQDAINANILSIAQNNAYEILWKLLQEVNIELSEIEYIDEDTGNENIENDADTIDNTEITVDENSDNTETVEHSYEI